MNDPFIRPLNNLLFALNHVSVVFQYLMRDEETPRKRRSLRPVAFAAVAFSTISVISCVITLPIVYNHIQNVQSFMQNEVDFCKYRAQAPSSILLSSCVNKGTYRPSPNCFT
uniref:Nematode cuticle collagen N-terminal domain-containing protein n=1 Tax=Parascaris equorum TaxID=6256 RepID=A0A914RRI4_PAREQ